MNIKLWLSIMSLLAWPIWALAQNEEAPPEPSALANFLASFLPILVIAFLIWFFFGRQMKQSRRRTDEYIETEKLHQQRVEQLLERIAQAVEKKE